MKRKIKSIFATTGTAVLLLTGCQSVNQVDLNKFMETQAKAESLESKGVTSFQLDIDAKEIKDEKARSLYNMVRNLKMEYHMVAEDHNTLSMTGTFIISKGKIPFSMYINKNELVLQLDNAKKPIRVDISKQSPNLRLDESKYRPFVEKLSPAIVRNLPNPMDIKVESKEATVHGDTVKGHEIQYKIYGDQIPELVLSFMESVSKDDELIAIVADFVKESGEKNIPSAKEMKVVLIETIKNMKVELQNAKKDESFTKIFSKQNYIKGTSLIDNQLNERKYTNEVHIMNPNPGELDGFKGLNIRTEGETWNVNESVTAEEIKAPAYLDIEKADEPSEFLNTLNKEKSVLYDVLVNDLNINAKMNKK